MTALIVPDAAVILKWVLPAGEEPFAGEAHRLLEQFVAGDLMLVVPSLWYFEVGNTVGRRFPEEATEILRELRALALPEVSVRREWEEVALRLVSEHGVTFYDAAYHAIALTSGGTFVTADGRYVDRVGDVGMAVTLEEWSQA